MHKFFCYFSFLLVLAGCATHAQTQYNAIASTIKTTSMEMRTCMIANINDPRFAHIMVHLPSPSTNFQPSITQLADEGRPTKEEAKLLLELQKRVEPCKQSSVSKLTPMAPDIAMVFQEEVHQGNIIMLDLAKQKITWGEYNKRLQTVQDDAQKRFLIAVHGIENNLQAQNEAELARRQAASNALMQWSQQQQMINSMNRPRTCTGFGNSVTCY